MKAFVWLLLALLVVVASSLVAAKRTIHEAQASLAWPHVCGVIAKSEVVFQIRYVPKVLYRYEVAGKTFVGTRIGIGELSGAGYRLRQDAEREIERFKNGSAVPVFYDPVDPSKSALEIRAQDLFGAYPIVGFLGTFFLLVFVMRQILVIAPGWVFLCTLAVLFVLWVNFLINMRPGTHTSIEKPTCERRQSA